MKAIKSLLLVASFITGLTQVTEGMSSRAEKPSVLETDLATLHIAPNEPIDLTLNAIGINTRDALKKAKTKKEIIEVLKTAGTSISNLTQDKQTTKELSTKAFQLKSAIALMASSKFIDVRTINDLSSRIKVYDLPLWFQGSREIMMAALSVIIAIQIYIKDQGRTDLTTLIQALTLSTLCFTAYKTYEFDKEITFIFKVLRTLKIDNTDDFLEQAEQILKAIKQS